MLLNAAHFIHCVEQLLFAAGCWLFFTSGKGESVAGGETKILYTEVKHSLK